MEDHVDSIEPLDTSSPGLTAAPPVAPRQSVFRRVPWRWSDVVIGLAPLVSLRLADALMGPAWLSGIPSWLWLPIAILEEAWQLVYPLWIARRRHIGLPRLPRPRTIFVETLVPLLVVAGGVVVLSLVFLLLRYLSGDQTTPIIRLDPSVGYLDRFEFLRLLVLGLLVAPVAEEVFFRGLLYNALRQRLPMFVAVLLQAVAFGLIHPFGLAGAAAVAVGGLALGLVYERRKTLLAPILLHALVNATGMTLIAWGIATNAVAPRLGVSGETDERGCRLTMVAPGSAADTAGLRVGDVIVTLDGEPIADLTSLTQAVRSKRLGQKVVIEFIRNGEPHQVEAVFKKLRE
jgi:membrane protease YdiL (CAAX protease family)